MWSIQSIGNEYPIGNDIQSRGKLGQGVIIQVHGAGKER